jgi:hypothetical protein
VWYVEVSPLNLSLDAAKTLFGPDFRLIHYAFYSCLGDAEASPIYESEDGPLEFVVYPRAGIVLQFEQRPDRVTSIDYNGKPIGAKKSRCKK